MTRQLVAYALIALLVGAAAALVAYRHYHSRAKTHQRRKRRLREHRQALGEKPARTEPDRQAAR